MSLGIMIAFIVMTIILLIALTIYLYFHKKLADCRSNPNYWCYKDWICNNDDGTTVKPAEKFYGCEDGKKRDENFCDDPKNATSFACLCLSKYNNDPTKKSQCSCKWNGQLKGCGNDYCSKNASTVNCNKT